MNKAQLIEAISVHYSGSKAEATKALNAVVETITAKTAAGEKVAITGFGVFEKVSRAARMVRNPRTGERKKAKATAVPKFRPGSELKAYVSGAKKLPRPGAQKAATTKTAAKATPAKSSAKKASAKASAKSTSPAKKAPAKKAPAKKAPAKKATAKR